MNCSCSTFSNSGLICLHISSIF
ncbi:MAG: SWIM zinc finger family protein [Desmonostoc vinosum HA7617-LM4]|nr:SWIM zinc finger family protein [Desmonostoc vinosum HA7617-LM4]